MRTLSALAHFCALLGGLLLTGITLMTCASLIGRNTTGWTLVGDFELSAVTVGAAIALFMPLCQLRSGHIIVDFFTTRASRSTQNAMDRLGALCVGLAFALLAWRTALGGLNAFDTHSETTILGFPTWISYAAMVPAFALTAAIGFWQGLVGLSPEQAEAGDLA
jgi:TRAP-type C4-dicarboxylate transport system permease small subunit